MGKGARSSVWLVLALTCGAACTKGPELTAFDAAILPDPAATTTREVPVADARESGVNHPPGTLDPGLPSSPPSRPRLLPAIASSTATPVPAAHPLAEWMRGPLTDAFNSGSLEAIATSFEQMGRWTPEGYTNWRSIAKDGASAARAGSLDAVKAACRGCHSQYEARYKQERANQQLP